jgi:NDP-sugar pyrophosphorylase family protein
MLPVAILAGGAATRLGAIARDVPKALVEVAGRPFLMHQLELLRRRGIRDVVLCVGHLGAQIEATVGDGASCGVRVRYSHDGERPLGTGGALRHALPLLGDAFFVLNGDTYLDCDYEAVARALLDGVEPAVLTVFRNDNRGDHSNVLYVDGRIVRYSKTNRSPDMQHIDAGLAAIRSDVFASYPDGEPFDLARVYEDLASRDAMAPFELPTRFFDMGTPAGLVDTQTHLARVR